MGNKLALKLDRYLAETGRDAPVEEDELRPLLDVAASLAAMPRVEPSPRFRETAQGRLMARLGQEASRVKVAELEQRVPVIDDLADFGERLRQVFTRAFRVAVPVGLTLLVAAVLFFTASNLSHAPVAYASECTLSVLGGSVEITNPGADSQAGADGMVLQAGTRVRTSADARAILTFFDGSTLTLDPGTDIEVKQVDTNGEQGVTIILKQLAGRTWSRVVKMADSGSRYEIETPTATAVVRGTLFTTEVDEQGQTTVATTEGLVSVAARGEEVFIPPQQQASVPLGGTPAPPIASLEATSGIMVNIGPGAVGSIVDPYGASTGHLPEGTAFNQIPGSEYLTSEDGSQEITIPGPAAGEYTLVLRSVNGEAFSFSITGSSAGQAVFSYENEYGGNGENGYIVRFRLEAENGLITGGHVNGTEPLRGERPEKVVAPGPNGLEPLTAESASQNGKGQTVAMLNKAGQDETEQPAADTGKLPAAATNENSNSQTWDENAVKGLDRAAEVSNDQGQSDAAPGQNKDNSTEASDLTDQTTDTPGQSGNVPGQTGDTPGKSGDTPGKSGDSSGKSGSASGQTNNNTDENSSQSSEGTTPTETTTTVTTTPTETTTTPTTTETTTTETTPTQTTTTQTTTQTTTTTTTSPGMGGGGHDKNGDSSGHGKGLLDGITDLLGGLLP